MELIFCGGYFKYYFKIKELLRLFVQNSELGPQIGRYTSIGRHGIFEKENIKVKHLDNF